jgi:lipid II:glycine glycyltransferase (peptidoglycan interpeptide bridge formation enzyme)
MEVGLDPRKLAFMQVGLRLVQGFHIIAAVSPMQSLETVSNSRRWDDWLTAHDGHLLQSTAWGELKSRFGWRAERIWWSSREKIHAGAQVLYREFAPTLALAYLPRGPICPGVETVVPFLEQLQEHVRSRGVFMLKLEPDWAQDDPRSASLLRVRALHTPETVQPPGTVQIDLQPELETILARMKPKWRYNIRLAEKKGVTVRAGTSEDIPAFYNLMRITGERDRFAIHGEQYYRTAFELLDRRDMVRLFVAEYAQQPLAMIFVTAVAHEAIYLYGASGNAERNRMPNHALHWAAIQWARARGCRRYDLWGIPQDAGETASAENLPSSLYQFKQGFGGHVVRYAGAWDVIFNQALYRAYRLARRMRKSGFG